MKLPWYMRQQLPVVLVAGLGGFVTVVDLCCGQPWAATSAPTLQWKALASSADGTTLLAVANTSVGYFRGPPTPIFVSTNAGATWIETGTPDDNWSSVACSADGTKWVAVTTCVGRMTGVGDGFIYTSSDLGATWTRTSAPSNNWTSVASSADGAGLVAVAAPYVLEDTNGNWSGVGGGTVYRSLDSGATWSRTGAPSNAWTAVAASADGAKLVAVAARLLDPDVNYLGDGGIYRSLDSGGTWSRTGAPSNAWTAVAASADGAKLVAVAAPLLDPDGNYLGDGRIYTSSDSGVTWSLTTAPSNSWSAVASSADGTKLVGGSGFLIYTSGDSGKTWAATDAVPACATALASSADGYRVVAGGFWTPLCTLPYSGPWRLAEAPATCWNSVACAADGAKLVAVAGIDGYSGGEGLIYASSNSGLSWRPTIAPTNNWRSVACSADGTKVVAAAGIDKYSGGDGLIYTSGNSGGTWTPAIAPATNWQCVAGSADGTKVVAAANQIYTSSDSGATWSLTTAPTNSWRLVACSADGVKLVAGADNGGDGSIYASSNSGTTWTKTTAPSNNWRSATSSADGTRLVAAAALQSVEDENGNWYMGGDATIYSSPDSGATWSRTSAPSNNWQSVASSADGTKLVVASVGIFPLPFDGTVYGSLDSGATWTPAGAPAAGANWWSAVACSADGSNLVAVANGAGICTLRSPAPAPALPPSPQMAVDFSGAALDLSWLVPSSRFVLQQNSDLDSTNWVDVSASPTLDFTNLHHRVTLTPSLGRSYFRLKQQ